MWHNYSRNFLIEFNITSDGARRQISRLLDATKQPLMDSRSWSSRATRGRDLYDRLRRLVLGENQKLTSEPKVFPTRTAVPLTATACCRRSRVFCAADELSEFKCNCPEVNRQPSTEMPFKPVWLEAVQWLADLVLPLPNLIQALSPLSVRQGFRSPSNP